MNEITFLKQNDDERTIDECFELVINTHRGGLPFIISIV